MKYLRAYSFASLRHLGLLFTRGLEFLLRSGGIRNNYPKISFFPVGHAYSALFILQAYKSGASTIRDYTEYMVRQNYLISCEILNNEFHERKLRQKGIKVLPERSSCVTC